MKIIPIILAGGSGKRLKPLSSNSLPKQFLRYHRNENSFFQMVLKRAMLLSSTILVVSNIDFQDLIEKDTSFINEDLVTLHKIFEPIAKNTAACFLLSAMYIDHLYGDQKIIFMPSDHVMDESNFIAQVNITIGNISKDNIYCFGVIPKLHTSDYGYMILDESNRVIKFIEKPSEKIIQKIRQSKYCCNSGIYFGYSSCFINAFKSLEPRFYNLISQIIENLFATKNKNYIDQDIFSQLTEISFDKMISEKIENLIAKKIDCSWNDVGSINRFWESGNIANELIIDSKINLEDFVLLQQENEDFDFSYNGKYIKMIKKNAAY